MVEQFHARLSTALRSVSLPVRDAVIHVDGGDDGSAEKFGGLGRNGNGVNLVRPSRDIGQQLVIMSAVDHATRDATVVIDTGSGPLEVIRGLIANWRDGSDVVDVHRSMRSDKPRRMLHLMGWFDRIARLALRDAAALRGGPLSPKSTAGARGICRRATGPRYIAA